MILSDLGRQVGMNMFGVDADVIHRMKMCSLLPPYDVSMVGTNNRSLWAANDRKRGSTDRWAPNIFNSSGMEKHTIIES